MSKFVDCDREQAFLLPPDLRDWIAVYAPVPGDLSHGPMEPFDP